MMYNRPVMHPRSRDGGIERIFFCSCFQFGDLLLDRVFHRRFLQLRSIDLRPVFPIRLEVLLVLLGHENILFQPVEPVRFTGLLPRWKWNIPSTSERRFTSGGRDSSGSSPSSSPWICEESSCSGRAPSRRALHTWPPIARPRASSVSRPFPLRALLRTTFPPRSSCACRSHRNDDPHAALANSLKRTKRRMNEGERERERDRSLCLRRSRESTRSLEVLSNTLHSDLRSNDQRRAEQRTVLHAVSWCQGTVTCSWRGT